MAKTSHHDAAGGRGPGLRTLSGFVAGLVGGTIGSAVAFVLILVAPPLRSSIFGRAALALPAAGFGAVVAAALLTTNATMIDRRTPGRWLVHGLLGASVATAAFAIATLILAGAREGDGRIGLAAMVFYGSLGLSIGCAAGFARRGAAVWTGLAGGTTGITAGLLSGPFLVVAAPIIAAVIGAAIGAIRPRETRNAVRRQHGRRAVAPRERSREVRLDRLAD